MENNTRYYGSPDEVLETVKVNPYKIFNLDPEASFTRSQLRQRMKKLVLVTHPDKPTGSKKKFRIVRGCYDHLLKVIEKREKTTKPITDTSLRSYEDTRDDEYKGLEIPGTNASRLGAFSDKFDLKSFNTDFEKNRLDDTFQRGHGEWLKSETKDYEKSHREKFDKGRFQESFEDTRKELLKKTQLVKFTDITGMSLKGTMFASSDIDDIGMNSSQTSGTIQCLNGVTGVDIREAHEIGIIPVVHKKEEEYTMTSKDMEEKMQYKRTESIRYTDDELRELRQKELQRKEFERNRQERLKLREKQINDHFQRVNRMITDS